MTFCFFLKLNNEIKRELDATESLRMFWNQTFHCRSVAVFDCQMFKKWWLKLGRMYQTAHQNDGYNALRLYCSKLNPACLCYDSKPAKLHKARWAIQLLNHLLGLPNLASSRLILSRAIKHSDVSSWGSFLTRIVNLLNISSVSTKL